jgi:hypothetical protein
MRPIIPLGELLGVLSPGTPIEVRAMGSRNPYPTTEAGFLHDLPADADVVQVSLPHGRDRKYESSIQIILAQEEQWDGGPTIKWSHN